MAVNIHDETLLTILMHQALKERLLLYIMIDCPSSWRGKGIQNLVGMQVTFLRVFGLEIHLKLLFIFKDTENKLIMCGASSQ